LTAALIVLGPAALWGQVLDPAAARDLVVRVDAAMFPVNYQSSMTMTNWQPGDQKTSNQVELYRRGEKMIAIIRAPKLQQGQALLKVQDDMWFFLPKSQRVTRIGAKDKSFGGEVSNTDLLQTDMAAVYDIVCLGRENLAGTECWKLELSARKRSVANDRVLYWISVSGDLPQRREYYSVSGKHLRTMLFADFRTFIAKPVPASITIINELNSAYKSEVAITAVVKDPAVPESMFTTAWLEQGGSLR